jgi:hypothetical protein
MIPDNPNLMVRKSVSLTKQLLEYAEKRSKELYSESDLKFSQYIRHLIRRDMEGK